MLVIFSVRLWKIPIWRTFHGKRLMSFFRLPCSFIYIRQSLHLLLSFTGVLRLNSSKFASIDKTAQEQWIMRHNDGHCQTDPSGKLQRVCQEGLHCPTCDLCVHLQHGGWGALQPHSGQGRPGLHRTRCVPIKPTCLIVVVSFGSCVFHLCLGCLFRSLRDNARHRHGYRIPPPHGHRSQGCQGTAAPVVSENF